MTNWYYGRIVGLPLQFPMKRESLMQPSVHSLLSVVILILVILLVIMVIAVVITIFVIFFILVIFVILFILFVTRYAVKYNEQLILTLEEDEFSCKQRLAYKLEQVHNIMQGDAQ